MPSQPAPIFVVGAGGIVNTAHLPAYALAGFPVQGILDTEPAKAIATARAFNIPQVFESLKQMIREAPANAVFDLAIPGLAMPAVLEQLPAGSAVLLQKPMGENIAAAREILEIARSKKMVAGVNFQLRYAPPIMEVRSMLEEGMLGDLFDIEVYVNVYTPWHLWDFLSDAPRVEMLYHSIHYIDLIRSFLGNPESLYAKTVKHPATPSMAAVRSNIIMDYGTTIRANILTNHGNVYGHAQQQSYIKFEGTRGVVKVGLGILKNYPQGEPDTFDYVLMENGQPADWKTKEVEGSWFPHAFIGSMAQIMLAAEGTIDRPDNSVEDCFHTMACVEAAYRSSEAGGIKPEQDSETARP